MVCILPTTDELNEALARAKAAYAARFPGVSKNIMAHFEAWCRAHALIGIGPHISANVIGIPDARLLADGFDFAMQQIGCTARARRMGF